MKLKGNLLLSALSPYLKSLAVLGILYYHYFRASFVAEHGQYPVAIQWQWVHAFSELQLNSPSWFEGVLRNFGFLGVTIFFILSGWGLGHSYLQKGYIQIPYREFLKKRLLRIAPLYYFAILVSVLFYLIKFAGDGSKQQDVLVSFLMKATFLHTFHPRMMANYNSTLWFIGTLFFLYLMFPLLYGMMRKLPGKTLLASLLVAGGSSLIILKSPLNDWHPYLAMGGFPLTKLGEFAFGVFLAVSLTKQGSAVQPWKEPSLLKPFKWMGAYSYGVLLFHRPWLEDSMVWFNAMKIHSPIVQATLFIVVAALLFGFLEKGFNALWNRVN